MAPRLDYYLEQRHTYVGITVRPVTIDSLRTFDPVRYAPLSWDLDREEFAADPEANRLLPNAPGWPQP